MPLKLESKILQQIDVSSKIYNFYLKMSEMCNKAIAKVDPPLHIVLFIINIIFPGVGSICSSFMDKNGFNAEALIFGVLQFVLWFALIGWFWSIYHGFLIYQKSEAN